MGQIVDSSVFIDFERRGHDVDLIKTALGDEPSVIAAITASELLVGVHRADTVERRQQRAAFCEDVFDLVRIEPFDLSVSRIHAELWARLTSTGSLIGAHDLMIAATALTRGHNVLTHNLRDFEKVPGLSVLQPDW